jgi:hypothetical protein
MAIRWEEFPHSQIRRKIYKNLAQNGAGRSSESSLRHILRRKLPARNARDHERHVELVAARLIEELRCTRDVYQKFVNDRKCHPAFEAHWVVLRCAVFPTAIELLRQEVIEYTKLTQVPAQYLSLLFGIPTHVCYEDVTSGFGVIGPPDLDDRSLASDTELESLGRLLDDETVLHFEDIKNGGAIFQLFGGGPFATDDQGSIHRSWALCGLQQQFTLLEWVPMREKLWHLCSPWSDGLVGMFAAVQEELLSQRGFLLLDSSDVPNLPQGVHGEAPEAQENTTELDRRRAVIISKVKSPKYYRVLTIEEATLYFEVGNRTIYRWLEEEKLRSGARRGSITIESIRRLEARRSRKRPSS